MRKFLDTNDPFFTKPWRRWAATLVPLGWGAFEMWLQNPFWGLMFLAAGAYAGLELLIKRPPDK